MRNNFVLSLSLSLSFFLSLSVCVCLCVFVCVQAVSEWVDISTPHSEHDIAAVRHERAVDRVMEFENAEDKPPRNHSPSLEMNPIPVSSSSLLSFFHHLSLASSCVDR
jgi:hypothetical protein